MPRDIYGNTLPLVSDSRDSDRFHDQRTGKDYVFDNGEWNELTQSTPAPAGPTIPEPEEGDAGKAIVVGDDLSYELGTVSGGGDSTLFLIRCTIEFVDGFTNYTLDATYQNILDEVEAGKFPLIVPVLSVVNWGSGEYGMSDTTGLLMIAQATPVNGAFRVLAYSIDQYASSYEFYASDKETNLVCSIGGDS